MKLLQRYIVADLLRVFSLLVVVLTVMLVFVGVLREATDQNLGMNQIVQIMPYVVPSILTWLMRTEPYSAGARSHAATSARSSVPLLKAW